MSNQRWNKILVLLATTFLTPLLVLADGQLFVCTPRLFDATGPAWVDFGAGSNKADFSGAALVGCHITKGIPDTPCTFCIKFQLERQNQDGTWTDVTAALTQSNFVHQNISCTKNTSVEESIYSASTTTGFVFEGHYRLTMRVYRGDCTNPVQGPLIESYEFDSVGNVV
jgi:hypothetical protein